MPSVPRSPAAGQTPARTFDVTNSRAVFVWITEARAAFDDLLSVAVEATRAPGRRKLTREAARTRYRRARAAVTWLFGQGLDAPDASAPASTAPRFESFAE